MNLSKNEPMMTKAEFDSTDSWRTIASFHGFEKDSEEQFYLMHFCEELSEDLYEGYCQWYLLNFSPLGAALK